MIFCAIVLNVTPIYFLKEKGSKMANSWTHQPQIEHPDFPRGLGDPDFYLAPWEMEICKHDDHRYKPFKDHYLIYANGKIFSKSRVVNSKNRFGEFTKYQQDKWLKPTGKTYKKVELTDGKQYSVHRLVAKAFLLNPENKPQVNHLDSNPSHNCVSNLEWCTQSENIKHGIKYGNVLFGELQIGAKLTWEKADQIRNRLKSQISLQKIADEFGVSKRTIQFIKNGEHWKIEQKPKHKTPNVYRKKHWSERVSNPFAQLGVYEPREFGDYTAASPEQNWEED